MSTPRTRFRANSLYTGFLSRMNDRLPPGCALLFALFGVLIGIVGIGIFGNSITLITRGMTTRGIIVSYHVATNCRYGDDFLVHFATATGQEIELDKTASSCSNAYHVGQVVPILYDPANPQQAQINTFNDLWLTPAGIIALGLVFTIVFGAAANEKHQRKKRVSSPNRGEIIQLEANEVTWRNQGNVLDNLENAQILLSEASGDGIIIYLQKRRLILAIAGCALFVAAGVWMVQDHTVDGVVFGILCLLFFGLGLLVLLYRLLIHAPLLVINEEGVSMAQFGGLSVKWEEIALINVSRHNYAFRVYAFICSENRQAFLLHQSHFARFLFRCFPSAYPHYQDMYRVIDLSSPLVQLPMPGYQLIQRIQRVYPKQLEEHQIKINMVDE